jgi:hypothetical protein
MARGSTRRSYVRDGRGRFASTGTTGTKAKPAARRAQRGTNRLTRDNSGKITGAGKNGATARGGRIRTAAGNQRGAVLDRMKKRQSPSGAIRATDVVKAKTHNYMSRMVEKNQARYDNYAIKTGRTPVAENATRRVLAAQSRIAKQDRAKSVARPVAPAKPTTKPTTKPKRQTRQQKADAYVERINRIGEGRTGVKAKRAARIRENAASFASGLAGFHKRQKAKTREELKKGLSEAFGNQKRMKAYGNFVGEIGNRSRPQSGKQSLIRPGQTKRAQERLGQIAAAVRAPYSRWNPNPARRNPAVNRRSAETVRMASEWYQGNRPAGKAKQRSKPVLMPQLRAKSAPKRITAAQPAGTMARPQGRRPVPTARSTRTVYRTKAQATRAQQARTNALGKATAAKRGYNEVSAANFRARIAGRRGDQQMFADSAPRTVIGRPRIQQLSISGRVERVGAGRFRTVGERLGGGSIRRPRSKPGPMRGTKAWKRQLEQLVKANGGKDVAAFRF